MHLNTSGKSKPRARTHTCVIYDPKDGQIRHIHSVTTLGRTKAGTEKDVEQEAYALAREGGRTVRGARTLHLHDADLKPYITYRVDVNSASLVEESVLSDIDRPAPRRAKKGK